VNEWHGWIGSVITVDLLNPAAVVVKWDNMPGCPQTVKSSSIVHYIAPIAEPTPFKPGNRVRVTEQASAYYQRHGTVIECDGDFPAPWTIRVFMDTSDESIWFRPDGLELVQPAPRDDQCVQFAEKDKHIAELERQIADQTERTVDWQHREASMRVQRDAARAESDKLRAENRRLKQKCNRWLGRYLELSAIVDRQRAVISAVRPVVEAIAASPYGRNMQGKHSVSCETVDMALAILDNISSDLEAKG
jgi:hypothetical protein